MGAYTEVYVENQLLGYIYIKALNLFHLVEVILNYLYSLFINHQIIELSIATVW